MPRKKAGSLPAYGRSRIYGSSWSISNPFRRYIRIHCFFAKFDSACIALLYSFTSTDLSVRPSGGLFGRKSDNMPAQSLFAHSEASRRLRRAFSSLVSGCGCLGPSQIDVTSIGKFSFLGFVPCIYIAPSKTLLQEGVASDFQGHVHRASWSAKKRGGRPSPDYQP